MTKLLVFTALRTGLASILPLRKDAPICLAAEARPDFSRADHIAELRGLELVPLNQAELRP